jgi:hypothetical protein
LFQRLLPETARLIIDFPRVTFRVSSSLILKFEEQAKRKTKNKQKTNGKKQKERNKR